MAHHEMIDAPAQIVFRDLKGGCQPQGVQPRAVVTSRAKIPLLSQARLPPGSLP